MEKMNNLLTKGNFDADFAGYNEAIGNIYFMQVHMMPHRRYLYRINLNNTDTVRVTPAVFEGTNIYRFSPDAKYATHTNANIHRNYNFRLVNLT